MIEKSKQLLKQNETIVRYGIMAVAIVAVEYGTYLLFLTVMNYLLAVPLSMAVGIVLNWYCSRVFVFKTRRHTPRKEFTLTVAASLVGVGIQTLVAYIVVHSLRQTPELAKLVAIVITFFWNYYIRKRYIF